ncbi:MAG: cobalamin-dependent protein [Deltaproteobacteria bacterium]|nr:cobalamin-dependent protein [Deltaproteobacteria bacterium]
MILNDSNIQVSLISPYSNTLNLGLRIISAILRNSGYKTQMIFLPSHSSDSALNISPFSNIDYPETIIQQVVNITRDSSIIGISLMDNYMQVGIKLTQALKNKSNLVIWGGVLPSLNPEEALQYADAVCIGEGEDAMLELVRKMNNSQDINSIPNIWFKGKSRPEKKYISDVSSLPLPDYGPEGHFIYSEKEQIILSLETCDEDKYQDYLFEKHELPGVPGEMQTVYHIETTRGCPHNCTYCANNILKKIITPKVRWKSLDQIEDELNWVKKKFLLLELSVLKMTALFIEMTLLKLRKFLKNQGFLSAA